MQLTKKEVRFLEFIILVLFLLGGYVFRFLDVFQTLWIDSVDQSYFQLAQVTEQTFAYTNFDIITNAYVYFLHLICLVFGNDYFLCSIAHFCLFALAMLVWYFAIKKILGTILSLVLFACAMLLPFCIKATINCNPIALFLFFGGILIYIIISCVKTIVNIVKSKKTNPDTTEEPVITVVNFDEEKAVSVPPLEEEKPLIFIPKSMEIPKREAKPKLDYSLAVAEDALFYDVDVEQHDDYDFL